MRVDEIYIQFSIRLPGHDLEADLACFGKGEHSHRSRIVVRVTILQHQTLVLRAGKVGHLHGSPARTINIPIRNDAPGFMLSNESCTGRGNCCIASAGQIVCENQHGTALLVRGSIQFSITPQPGDLQGIQAQLLPQSARLLCRQGGALSLPG